MSATIINLIIQIIAGAVGGNAIGSASKNMSLGGLGNTIAGALGGIGLGQLAGAVMPALQGAADGSLDIGAIIGQIVGGGIGGGIGGIGVFGGGGGSVPEEFEVVFKDGQVIRTTLPQ